MGTPQQNLLTVVREALENALEGGYEEVLTNDPEDEAISLMDYASGMDAYLCDTDSDMEREELAATIADMVRDWQKGKAEGIL